MELLKSHTTQMSQVSCCPVSPILPKSPAKRLRLPEPNIAGSAFFVILVIGLYNHSQVFGKP